MNTIKKVLVALLLGIFSFSYSQSTVKYQGKDYVVQTGTKGGKYIILSNGEHKYVSSVANYVVTGNTVTWKGKQYPLVRGPKGGLYFLVNGKRKYLPKDSK